MTSLRAVLIGCSVLMLSACGSSSERSQSVDEQQTTTAAIESIDEPAESAIADVAALAEDPNAMNLFSCDQGEPDAREDCRPTPEQAEQLRQDLQVLIRAYRPAKGAEPRAIARLPLSAPGSKSYARLVAWRNGSGRLCVQTELEEEASSPDGPCIPGNPCGKLCVELSQSGEGNETVYVSSGVVSSEADTLRITLDDGRVIDYRLTGPKVPGFDEYRIFMLELGRALDQRLELLRDGKTIAEEKRSPAEIMGMRCEEDFPPALPTQESQGRGSQRDDCLKRAGSQ